VVEKRNRIIIRLLAKNKTSVLRRKGKLFLKILKNTLKTSEKTINKAKSKSIRIILSDTAKGKIAKG
jgi:hypothetical protein